MKRRTREATAFWISTVLLWSCAGAISAEGVKDRLFRKKNSEEATASKSQATEANAASPMAFPTKHDIQPLALGEKIGPTLVHNLEGEIMDLAEKLLERPSVVVFFQGSWCPYCLRQLSELRTIEGELRSLGFQLLALSPDRWDYINSVRDKRKLRYTLYSDHQMAAARAFGVAFKVPEMMKETFRGFGLDLLDYHDSEHGELPVPAVFVIDQEGAVRFAYANPNIRERANPQVVLAAARDIVN